jgi:hypothetical protein
MRAVQTPGKSRRQTGPRRPAAASLPDEEAASVA